MDDKLTAAERATVEDYRNFGSIHWGDFVISIRDRYQAIIDRLAPKPVDHKRCPSGHTPQVMKWDGGCYYFISCVGVPSQACWSGPVCATEAEAWSAWDSVWCKP